MAEGANGAAGKVYEDFKFLTRAEVEELSAGGLIGTPALKGYMHGFFMEMKLYSKLRAVSKPFEYEEHRKKKIRDKIDEKRQSRINAKKRLPKVNSLLAEKFMKGKKGNEEEIVDDRFSALFKRSEFEQDQESHEFKLRNPSGGPGGVSREYDSEDDDLHGDMDYFTKVSTSSTTRSKYGDSDENNEYSDELSSDDDSITGAVKFDAGDRAGRGKKTSKSNEKKKDLQKTKQMYEISAGSNSEKVVFGHTAELQKKRKLEKRKQSQVLGHRVSAEVDEESGRGSGGSASNKVKIIKSSEGIVREMSYIPKSNGMDEVYDDFKDDGRKKSKKASKR